MATTGRNSSRAKKTTKSQGAGKERSKRDSGKRELIAPHGDKRFIRRDESGKFRESVEVGKSLARDIQQHAKTKVKHGQGDRGDE
jgi:hypothetical protein